MDWDTALSQELKRFNAKAGRSMAMQKERQGPNESPASKPMTWDEALKRMLRQATRKAARTAKAKLPTLPE